MKRTMLVILLIGLALGQGVFNPIIGQTIQDTVAVKARIAELQVTIDGIAQDANERIQRVRYAIFVLEDMLNPPKEEVEEPKKKGDE